MRGLRIALAAAVLPLLAPGPRDGGAPWVISGDTGVHPGAAGYAQVPATQR
jgi:hypothetical protein